MCFFKHPLLYIVYDYISRLTSAADTQLFNDGVLTSELMYVENDRALIGGGCHRRSWLKALSVNVPTDTIKYDYTFSQNSQ